MRIIRIKFSENHGKTVEVGIHFIALIEMLTLIVVTAFRSQALRSAFKYKTNINISRRMVGCWNGAEWKKNEWA